MSVVAMVVVGIILFGSFLLFVWSIIEIGHQADEQSKAIAEKKGWLVD